MTERASIGTIEDYKKAPGFKTQSIKPLGVVHLKSWEGPGLDVEDLTDDEDESPSNAEPAVEVFWVEDTILPLLFVGMKLELVVQELNIGIKFFDTVVGVYCSFYSALPNEKVIEYWKEPS